METVSDEDDDDGTAATEECTDEESLGDIDTRRELSSVHLSRFASEQRGTAALDVDRYAGSLMRQLGIDDPDDLQPPEAAETGTVQGIQTVARFLVLEKHSERGLDLLMLRS